MLDYLAARTAQVFLVSVTVIVVIDAIINGVY
jgi:hypothetical protein